ncbi:hypothetical protein FHX74_002630 [Friedmanniella endophytica]|uniref:CDP-Glycerol:Poly(Glycerophosphate) glycerophosphotransferase n=1 Tax=Microlunatus kandeliicorticis TaxID=1759536 RepID=A0A7W3ITK8_9ACTN|nr:CDP-glycerol glycerophosphotransferase family protein [Microlunatus kandeliicorticis]MBA8795002.1 hypothetical protein [Microlunatus kandeliicorticis]
MRGAALAVARGLLPELLAALTAALAVVLAARLGTAEPAGPGAAAVIVGAPAAMMIVLTSAVHGRLRPTRRPNAVQLPGFAAGRPGIGTLTARVLGWLAVLLVAVTLLLGLGPVAVAVAVLAALGGLLLVLTDLRARRAVPARRAALTWALTAYAPEFVVYTARRNDASYQLRMWLPQLEKLGRRYVVMVRDPAAVEWARTTTAAPVVCAPAVVDLDAIAALAGDRAAVPSLRAAFYVNGVSENVQFVNYRALTHVYLGHGDSDKELSAHPMHAMFDRVFVAGPAARDRYPAARVSIPPDRFVEVGRPQLAGLAGAGERPPGRGWRVLLAPTWRGYNARTRLGSLAACPALARLLVAAGAAVVFRPHPFSWQGGDRRLIAEVDAVLAADAGRGHASAVATRSWTTAECFDAADAMITDVGSMLVDFFATRKPYAVVLPAGVDAATLAERYPSTAAAYSVDPTALGGAGGSGDAVGRPPPWLAALRPDASETDDPLRAARAALTRHYLGDRPRDDRPFLDAVRAVLERGPASPS